MVYYNFNDLPCQKQITDTRFVWHIFIVSFIFLTYTFFPPFSYIVGIT